MAILYRCPEGTPLTAEEWGRRFRDPDHCPDVIHTSKDKIVEVKLGWCGFAVSAEPVPCYWLVETLRVIVLDDGTKRRDAVADPVWFPTRAEAEAEFARTVSVMEDGGTPTASKKERRCRGKK